MSVSGLHLIGQWRDFMLASGYAANTVRCYRGAVADFLTDVAKEPRDVTEQDVVVWLASFDRSAAYKVQARRALRSFFSWCAERRHVRRDPTALLSRGREPKRNPPVSLRPEEMTRLVYAAAVRNPRRAWAILFSFSLGTRRAEVCGIRPEDVDWNASVVHLRITKYDKPRNVEMGPLARTCAEELLAGSNGTLLGIRPSTFGHWMKEAAIAAELHGRKRRTHTLRKTFAKTLSLRGVPTEVISDLLGHESLGPTRWYLSVDSEERREAAELME